MIRFPNMLKLRWGVSFAGKWIAACGLLAFFSVSSFTLSDDPQTQIYWRSMLFYGFVAFIVATGIVDWIFYFRPFSRRLRDNDWRQCPSCGYQFEEDGEVTCSECGKSFNGRHVREEWRSWIKPLRSKTKR